jgi:hypothetical protein
LIGDGCHANSIARMRGGEARVPVQITALKPVQALQLHGRKTIPSEFHRFRYTPPGGRRVGYKIVSFRSGRSEAILT